MVAWGLTRLTSSYREATVISSFASYVGDRLVLSSEAYERRSVLMCSLSVPFIESLFISWIRSTVRYRQVLSGEVNRTVNDTEVLNNSVSVVLPLHWIICLPQGILTSNRGELGHRGEA